MVVVGGFNQQQSRHLRTTEVWNGTTRYMDAASCQASESKDSYMALSSLEMTWFVLLEVTIQVFTAFLARKDCLNINDVKFVSTSFLPMNALKL